MAEIGDVEKMVAVGLVWGATNAFMRKGAVIWDSKTKTLSLQSSPPPSSNFSQFIRHRISLTVYNYLHLFLTWQYSIPLALNLTASATFFVILGNAPISLAVPVTNATTFAVTAVVAALLGEATRIGRALVGTLFIVLGVWLCVI